MWGFVPCLSRYSEGTIFSVITANATRTVLEPKICSKWLIQLKTVFILELGHERIICKQATIS